MREVADKFLACGVLENGEWMLVPLHASIPVTNAESFGDTFPGVSPGTAPSA